MCSRKRGKKSLADEVASLINPRPFEYEEDAQGDGAKICDDFDEDVSFGHDVPTLREMVLNDDDPKYGGYSVSRNELEQQWSTFTPEEADLFSESDMSSEHGTSDEEDKHLLSEDEEELDEPGDGEERESDEEDREYDQDDENDGQEEDTLKESIARESDEEGLSDTVTVLPVDGNSEDIEKGRAVKHQLALWDGLLEGRIKLQKCLSYCNQLPQTDTAQVFAKSGSLAVASVSKCEDALCSLLDSLTDLQKDLMESTGLDTVTNNTEDVASNTEAKRKETHYDTDNYEALIQSRYNSLLSYRDDTLDKWSTKLQLATGKLTMKSYAHRNHSVLSSIRHALEDKQKLRRRTRLKRSHQHVLGKKSANLQLQGNDSESVSERNVHLNDVDEEIFDDEDFYHQLLRELIQSKTSSTDYGNDQITMGRKWLELQSLRTKVKKKVDTKASKGRRLRYQSHPKLVNFMAPVIDNCLYSDTARYNLFSSLFDSRRQ